MKIAILGSKGYPYVYGGYETFVKELSERLVRQGYEVVIYCHKSLFKERPKSRNGIELVYVPSIETKVLSQFTHSFLSMVHVCFTRRADLILVVNSANGPFGILPRLFGIPTAINVDGLEWLRPKWAGLGARYFRLASRMATVFYDRIITDAQAMRQVYLNEFNTDSVVIEYGANALSSAGSTDYLTESGIEPRKYCLIVGRLIPDNNVLFMVREFERTKSDYKLVVVGDVPYRDRYADEVKSSKDKRIVFTGYVKDQRKLMQLYEHCFLYLHGHEFGGTNPALLKALAAGCCVLALDTVFAREVLAEGEYGIFFRKKEGDLSRKLDLTVENGGLCDKLRVEAPKRIQQLYTWERIVSKYTALFRSLAESANY